MRRLLTEIDKRMGSMGECAAISECKNYAGKTFYIASLYLWQGHPRPSAEAIAGWFKDQGCVFVSVLATLHEEHNEIAHGQGKDGEYPWQVTFSVPETLA